jgi:hypothetical protein
MKKYLTIALLSVALFNCKKDEHLHPHDDNELITRVDLIFTDSANKSTTFSFQDKDGDSRTSPEKFDKIVLSKDQTYTLKIEVYDDTKSPVENISDEILEEADVHLFVFKSNPTGLLTTTLTDKDKNSLPIGLESTVKTAATAGKGTYQVILKHQPELNGVKVKTGREEGGSTDIDLSFEVEVQ